MKKLSLLILPAFLISIVVKGQQNAYVSPAGTQFLLYTPPSYATGTQNHPLLISLHGKGEMGSNINMLTVNNPQQQPSRLIYLNRWPQTLPFIVLSPLFTPPPDEINPQWPAAYIDEVVNHVVANYRVDQSRIYITGLSLGGTGTWNYAAAYPHKIAAMVPICGRSDLTKACTLKNIPAWVFHGDGDPTVTMQYSIDMINAINLCKVSALYKRRLSVLHSRAHHGWSEVYNGSNGNPIYDWLLKFTKNNTTNTSPYVNAGLDRTVVLRPGGFHFYGDYFDADGTIATVLWKQISGTPLALSNTNSPYFRINTLQAGNFEFELTVTDNHGASASDRVKLTVLASTTQPVVTGLMLVNGQTNADVMRMTEGMTINKAQLGLTQINIRADVSSGTNSVRFTINADQHVRTLNSPGPYLIKTPSSSSPEWQIIPGHYVICATAYSTLGGSGTGCATCVKFKVIDEINVAGCTGYGKIYREIWPGVPGTSISDIPLTKVPAAKTELYTFESPTDVWDNFGERISGYICPPVTGNYTFWISSNDNSELWLSTDATAANKVRIASVTGFTNVRQWTKYASQRSAPIPLTAGTKYYIEALHKEGIESDHLAVGWQLPDGTQEMPIPGRRLIPVVSGAELAVEEVLDETRSARRGMTLYPNPAESGEKVMMMQDDGAPFFEEVRRIEIVSLTGQTVRAQQVRCADCASLEMDVSGLSPGVYVVNVITSGDCVVKRLLIR
jgi:poly(3-hydroxybutyrate) depolymerase